MRTLCLCLFLALTFMVGCAKGPGISEKSREVVEMKDEFKKEKPSCPDAGHEKVAEILPEKEIIPEPIHEKKEQVPEKVAEEVVKEAAPELQPELTDKIWVTNGRLTIRKATKKDKRFWDIKSRMASGQKNILVAQYVFKSEREGMTVRKISLWAGKPDGKTAIPSLTSSLKSVSLYANNVQIGKSIFLFDGKLTLNFNNFQFKAEVPVTLTIKVDVADKASVKPQDFVIGIACKKTKDGTCWGKSIDSYAITANGLASGQSMKTINTTGDSQGITEKPYQMEVLTSYLEVSLNPNSPSGNFTQGGSTEVLRLDLKVIGQEEITITKMELCFFSPGNTNSGDAFISNLSGVNKYFIWKNLQVGHKGKWACVLTSQGSIKEALIIGANSTKSVKWIVDTNSSISFRTNDVLGTHLKNITYTVGKSGKVYTDKVNVYGSLLEI